MMQYIKVANVSEINDGEKMKVSVEDDVILLSCVKGKYYAIKNKCPHMGGSLFDGTLDGYQIKCPRHGSVFDVRTGQSINGAKIAFVKIKVGNTSAYPVKVLKDEILVGVE